MGASRNTTVAEFRPGESSGAGFGMTDERLAGEGAITRHCPPRNSLALLEFHKHLPINCSFHLSMTVNTVWRKVTRSPCGNVKSTARNSKRARLEPVIGSEGHTWNPYFGKPFPS